MSKLIPCVVAVSAFILDEGVKREHEDRFAVFTKDSGVNLLDVIKYGLDGECRTSDNLELAADDKVLDLTVGDEYNIDITNIEDASLKLAFELDFLIPVSALDFSAQSHPMLSTNVKTDFAIPREFKGNVDDTIDKLVAHLIDFINNSMPWAKSFAPILNGLIMISISNVKNLVPYAPEIRARLDAKLAVS